MTRDSPLTPAPPPRELTAAELRFAVDAAELGFKTTAEITGDGNWLGQERALASLELALRVRHPGYNLYVCGLGGTHRERDLADLLRRFTADLPTPGDRVLVQNFKNRDRPRALALPAGYGSRLSRDMRELIEELRRALPKTFLAETFEEEKEKLSERFGEEGETINRQLASRAEQAGFAIQPGPGGEMLFIPLKEGRPMEPAEIQALSPEQIAEMRKRQRELSREVKAVLRQQQNLLSRLAREVKSAERRVAEEVVKPLVEELCERYEQDGVRAYLGEVREHILDNLGAFQERPQGAAPSLPFPFSMAVEEEPRLDYEVNVLVDNGSSQGAPIIIESSPTYKNLFGAVERMVDRFGKLVTNFTRVTAGSLLRAHGGCVILNVLDALAEPMVWRTLKRALKDGRLEIESYDPFALFATSTMRPEPMQLDTRVVLVGPTEIFQLLYFLDEEFAEIFKVRADFSYETDGAPARTAVIAQIARIARTEQLPPFTADAVAGVLEAAARSVGDRRKLPSQWHEIGDLVREAAFCARNRNAAEVTGDDVECALDQRRFRRSQVEEKIRELTRDKVILVDVDGTRVGQVNGLAVSDLGGHSFGRPSRITAAVSMGAAGLIAVDREAKMSGKTYDKAVFIIAGYLRHTYAQDFPLSLSASLSFEQSYGGIDGDSASAAEIFALVSALSGVALRQDLAVTGSVNQFGDVQPIGGVNEKIEGFFETCKAIGLTGRQGVVIPVQNLDNLALHRDVVDAVGAGQFHLYPVRTIDEGLEILTGIKAGTVRDEGTVHQRASARLRSLAEGMRQFAAPPRRNSSGADRDAE